MKYDPETIPRSFIGRKEPGEHHGAGMVITGNFKLMREAAAFAEENKHFLSGYLSGKYARGWVTYRRATPEETDQYFRAHPEAVPPAGYTPPTHTKETTTKTEAGK